MEICILILTHKSSSPSVHDSWIGPSKPAVEPVWRTNLYCVWGYSTDTYFKDSDIKSTQNSLRAREHMIPLTKI